jgi:hypothetical protein
MIGDRNATIDLNARRSVLQILMASVRLYWAYPLVFALLALAVVAPYDLLVLAATGKAPLATQSAKVSTALTLTLIDLILIGPLISALHVQAVRAAGDGERPRIFDVARLGLRALPVVAAAEIIAGLGVLGGLVLFVLPGIYLLIRWAVVAQAAAIERTDWMGALRRSGELMRGNYFRVIGFLFVVAFITFGLRGIGVAIAGTSSRPAQVAVGIVIDTIGRSFTALTTAVLYFDLVARSQNPGGL